MHRTNQTLSTAIDELRCVRPDSTATLTELHALSIARANLDQLIELCVDELRADRAANWSEIAAALGDASPDVPRVRFGQRPSDEQKDVAAFWDAMSPDFVWDFLPHDFLHALYRRWLRHERLRATELERKAFVARLRVHVSTAGGWEYRRSRPGALLAPQEPLVAQIPHWTPPSSNDAIYGLRRIGTIRPAGPKQ